MDDEETRQREIQLEEQLIKKLRFLVDFTAAVLRQSNITLEDSQRLIRATRERVLEIFPDKGETFDLIYLPRFRRILEERFHFL